MAESAELAAKLEKADADVQAYVKALKAENAKIHKRIYAVEAEKVSLESTLSALKEEHDKFKDMPTVTITKGVPQTEEELIERMRALGYRIEKIGG